MTEEVNRWVTAATGGAKTPRPIAVDTVEPAVEEPPAARGGLSVPISDLVPPDTTDRFPRRVRARAGEVWLVSTHGGAGSSSLGAALDMPATTRAWPLREDGQPVPVVLVCRSNFTGIEAARLAAREWASGSVPGVQVVGLVVVADASGRLPKELQRMVEHIAGAVPTVWRVGWEEDLRTAAATPELARGAWRRLASAMNTITSSRDQEQ